MVALVECTFKGARYHVTYTDSSLGNKGLIFPLLQWTHSVKCSWPFITPGTLKTMRWDTPSMVPLSWTRGMDVCAWVRLSRDLQEQQTRMHSNIQRDSLRSRAGKALLVLPFSLWKENTTLSFYGKKPYCVHRCWSKATEINTNICMVFRGPWIRHAALCSSWHVEGEAESGSSWFFALLFTLTGEEFLHHQHPGWGHYLNSKSGQGTTRVSEQERGGGMMESLFFCCAE